jgi:hypothetical protein
MPTRFASVTCPSCFESFAIAVPPRSELPTELDYDCEICCRPMVIFIAADGDDTRADARGINEWRRRRGYAAPSSNRT